MSESWVFNVELLKNIFKICRLVADDTVADAGINIFTWHDWMGEETSNVSPSRSGIPVLAFVRLCNTLRVPPRRFFYREGEEVPTFSRADLMLPKERFRPVRFDLDKFRGSFGKRSRAKLSIEKMLEKMGCTRRMHKNWVRDDTTLRVARLMQFCSVFGYDPLSFIVEENGDSQDLHVTYQTGDVRTGMVNEDGVKPFRDGLAEENRDLKEKVKALETENVSLMKDNAVLLGKNMELENEVYRLKQWIATLEGRAPEIIK